HTAVQFLPGLFILEDGVATDGAVLLVRVTAETCPMDRIQRRPCTVRVSDGMNGDVALGGPKVGESLALRGVLHAATEVHHAAEDHDVKCVQGGDKTGDLGGGRPATTAG